MSADERRYRADLVAVVDAVRDWAKRHPAHEMRWGAMNRGVLVAGALKHASRLFAANTLALQLTDFVVERVPGATWLMFTVAMDNAYGAHWEVPSDDGGAAA